MGGQFLWVFWFVVFGGGGEVVCCGWGVDLYVWGGVGEGGVVGVGFVGVGVCYVLVCFGGGGVWWWVFFFFKGGTRVGILGLGGKGCGGEHKQTGERPEGR